MMAIDLVAINMFVESGKPKMCDLTFEIQKLFALNAKPF